LRNASTNGAYLSSEVGSRNPITGIAGCCARTTSGESNVEPAKALMKSRLRTQSSTRVRQSFLQILSDRPAAGKGREAVCPLWVISRHVQRTSRCPHCANSGHCHNLPLQLLHGDCFADFDAHQVFSDLQCASISSSRFRNEVFDRCWWHLLAGEQNNVSKHGKFRAREQLNPR